MRRSFLVIVIAGLLAAAGVRADVSLTERQTVRQKKEAAVKSKQGRAARRAAKKAARRPGAPSNGPGKTLTDAAGLEWFIDTAVTSSTSSSNGSGAVSEASYQTAVVASTSGGGTTTSKLDDAYDGYNTLCVSFTNATGPCATAEGGGGGGAPIGGRKAPAAPNDYFEYFNGGTPVFECSNRQLAFGTKSISGVDISRKIFVPSNDSFARWLNYFTNTTGAPITFTMVTRNDLGSDNNTKIVTSSNGNATAELTDTWITTFQNFNGSNTTSDPRLGHVLQGPGAPVPLANIHFADTDDQPYWAYSLTIPPGGTQIIMNFGVAQPTKAAAAAKSAQLVGLPPNALQCMSPTEISQVVNFAQAASDLTITNVDSPDPVAAGANLTYTLNVSNSGPTAATAVTVTDTLPPGVTFQTVTSVGFVCSQAAGVVTCTAATLPAGTTGPITITVTAPSTSGTLTNTASVASVPADSNTGNNTAVATTTVSGGAVVSGTKTVTGSFTPGGLVTYTVTLSNTGAGPQLDNPGNEFTDVLPTGLTLVNASASSGTAVANTGTNSVAWNGSIPAAGSVTITILASVKPSDPSGSVVSNQGTIAFDADGNGTNESAAQTNDPSVTPPVPGGAPTVFTVNAAAVATIPTLSSLGLASLLLLLALSGAFYLRRIS